MPIRLEPAEIKELVRPMLLEPLPDAAYEQLSAYVQLLYRWNARMNLTAVRDARTLVELHIGECLYAAQLIPPETSSVLDFGSGAGLPGIPMQIARPHAAIILAESQTKKASFLRECVRELHLGATGVHSGRVEDLPADQMFDLVAMRAVDRMDVALQTALPRAGRCCMVLTSASEAESVKSALPALLWTAYPVPTTEQRLILLGSRP
jgi:16S rRNA (guanine527-N7)-methyltransferase